MYGNRESWIHEYNQDASISNNKNRIKRCRGYIMRILTNANSLEGHPVANYIRGFNMPNQQREVSGTSRFFNFLGAAMSESGEGFWHEWNQNHRITNAAANITALEAAIDPFFAHIQGITNAAADIDGLGLALAQFNALAMPANPNSGFGSIIGGIVSDAIFSGNSSENNFHEFNQNQNIREVSNRLAWIEAKISAIDTEFQNAFSNAIQRRDYASTQFIAQIVPGLSPENQQLANQMLDNGIAQNDAEVVKTAIRLGAQVNVAFNNEIPLLKAVRANNFAVVQALVVEGRADVNSYSKTSCCESFKNFFRFFCCMSSRTTTLLHIAAEQSQACVAGLLYQHANDSVRAQIDGAGHAASYYCADIATVVLPAPQQLQIPFLAVPAPNPHVVAQYAGVHNGAFNYAPPPYAFNPHEEHKFPQGFVAGLHHRQPAYNPEAFQNQGM